MTRKTKAVRFVSRMLAAIMAIMTIMACQQGLVISAFADSELPLTLKTNENVSVSVEGNQISVTDTDDNNDVWSSKALFEIGKEIVPGREYKISFDLNGDNGVGEFFLCKSGNLDNRYDETFTSEDGNRSVTFTATSKELYVGMQVGNIGKGNSVNARIFDICEREKSENPALLSTANCSVNTENGYITATDTSDNNDVWNSKLLCDAGVELEIGKSYKLNFSLSGDNGVGEFFVCRSQDLNDRYDSTFVNAGGNQSVTFTAVSDKLYIGMQFGNIGKGNSVDVCITEIKPYKKPENTFAEAPKISYEAAMENGVLVIRATDCSNNNDVWDSTLLYNIASNLIPGKKYEISFELSGDHGVGEFFLCKSNDLNSRYDATFLSDGGLKTVIFTAENANAFVGMQIGNVGKGNTVTAKILSLQPYDEVTGGSVGVKTAQSCTQSVTTEGNKTVIAAKDTSDNNDVWSSKLLYFFGSILEAGKKYIAKINLAGDNGVGEFFFLKSDNMDDRYSFDNEAGDHTVTFTAEGDKLYAGMQFGNIGKGNSVDVTIQDVFEKPFEQKSAENCSEDMNRGSVTLTDTDDNGDVWNSKAVYDTGIVLEKGKTYTATVKLSGDNVGEFFFLKSDNIDDRYSFSNTSGEHTITFTAEDTALLYFGVQCGNIGKGNSVTVSNITVKEADSTQPATLCIALTPVAERESAIEQSAVTEQETGTEQDAIAEQEPVAEQEPAVEQSAVTEQETGTEQDAIAEQEPVAEQEPAVEQSAVTEQETGTEQDTIAEQEPVAEQEPAVEQSAVTEQEIGTGQDTIAEQEPVAEQEPQNSSAVSDPEE